MARKKPKAPRTKKVEDHKINKMKRIIKGFKFPDDYEIVNKKIVKKKNNE